jgi:hypothetical protein
VWNIQHDGLTSYDYYVRFNSTGAQNNDIDVGAASPTSTVVTVGSHAQQNGSGNAMIFIYFRRETRLLKIWKLHREWKYRWNICLYRI